MVPAEINLPLTRGGLIMIGCVHSSHVCPSMMEACSTLMSRIINSFIRYLWNGPLVLSAPAGTHFWFLTATLWISGYFLCFCITTGNIFTIQTSGSRAVWKNNYHHHHHHNRDECVCLMTLAVKSDKMDLFFSAHFAKVVKSFKCLGKYIYKLRNKGSCRSVKPCESGTGGFVVCSSCFLSLKNKSNDLSPSPPRSWSLLTSPDVLLMASNFTSVTGIQSRPLQIWRQTPLHHHQQQKVTLEAPEAASFSVSGTCRHPADGLCSSDMQHRWR